MLAVNTNVLVRFLSPDGDEQPGRALALFGTNRVWISITVILETEWVLRSACKLSTREAAASFEKLIGPPGVVIEFIDEVMQAIAWAEEGLNFADALHLVRCGEHRPFATFDQRLLRKAKKLGLNAIAA